MSPLADRLTEAEKPGQWPELALLLTRQNRGLHRSPLWPSCFHPPAHARSAGADLRQRKAGEGSEAREPPGLLASVPRHVPDQDSWITLYLFHESVEVPTG